MLSRVDLDFVHHLFVGGSPSRLFLYNYSVEPSSWRRSLPESETLDRLLETVESTAFNVTLAQTNHVIIAARPIRLIRHGPPQFIVNGALGALRLDD
jgi:hypothetical protein